MSRTRSTQAIHLFVETVYIHGMHSIEPAIWPRIPGSKSRNCLWESSPLPAGILIDRIVAKRQPPYDPESGGREPAQMLAFVAVDFIESGGGADCVRSRSHRHWSLWKSPTSRSTPSFLSTGSSSSLEQMLPCLTQYIGKNGTVEMTHPDCVLRLHVSRAQPQSTPARTFSSVILTENRASRNGKLA